VVAGSCAAATVRITISRSVPMPQTWAFSGTITLPISASRLARVTSGTDAVPGSATGGGAISARICWAIRSSLG